MSRTIAITIPGEKRDRFIRRIQGNKGIAGISVQKGASVAPPGDVVTVQATNRATDEVVKIVEELDFLDSGSFAISEPAALVAPSNRGAIESQTNEAPWEEMLSLLRRDTNLSFNYLGLMTLSGGIAAVGLMEDQLHLVIGAMLVAPGFEPLVRMVVGSISGCWDAARRGVLGFVAGYFMLALGACLTLLVAAPLDPDVPPELFRQHWIQYWTSFKWSGVVIALLAGLAGTIIVTSHRTVFAAGVMIALALVPSMSIVGMGLVAGEFQAALQGFARWGLDVVCVLVASMAMIAGKRTFVHRRRALV